MAKVTFSKLGLKPNAEVKTIEWNGQIIEVLQYLPIQKKLGLMGRVLSYAHEEDANYANPVKTNVFTMLEILFEYTNITFTDKQKEDLPKLYDIVTSSGFLTAVIDAIPEDEYAAILEGVAESTEAVYKYQNSALGIIEILKGDMSFIENLDIEGMKAELLALTESPVVKQIAPLLGLE